MSEVTFVIATAGKRPEMLARAQKSARAQGAVITLWDPGIGYIRTRLAGLADVTTPYVAFLDDDDWLDPDWFERSSAIDADVVAASYWEVAGSTLREVRLLPASFEVLLGGHCPINDGALCRTDVLRDAPWRPERGTAAMFSMWLGLAARGASFGLVDEPCWYHRVHEGQMSAQLTPADVTWRAEAIAEYRAVPA